MTQEATSSEKTKETRKKILLGVLFSVLAVVLYFQFFSEEDSGPSVAGRAGRPGSAPLPTGASGAKPLGRGTSDAELAELNSPAASGGKRGDSARIPIVSQPLDLVSMVSKVTGNAGTGRNVFVYPTPTPPPPPPPPKPVPTPPPPPILLSSMSPSGVLARTGSFTLTLFGDKFPADGQILVEGRTFPTTITSATEARATIPAEAIRVAGNLGIQIRSQKDQSIYSNQLSINVAEPPPPLYRYVGLVITRKSTQAILQSIEDETIENVVQGVPFGKEKKWVVNSITQSKLIVEDTTNKITHTINFTGESGDK